MKKTIIVLFYLCISGAIYAQYTAIPDPEFEQSLITQGIDTEGILDGQILTSDISGLTNLDISNNFDITDLTGIQDFIALENLNCGNNFLSSLDLSNNPSLLILNCIHNQLTTLDVSGNLLLEELYCGNPAIDVGPFNLLTELDLSNNINLKILECIMVNISEIVLSTNNNLIELYCCFNNITELDLTNNPLLERLNVNFCHLTSLNLDNNIDLRHLTVTRIYPLTPWSNTNQIENLDLSNNVALETVWIEDSEVIKELNLKNGTNNILLSVHAAENPNLVCITVDDEVAANAGDYPYSEWYVDTDVFYSENCVLETEQFEESNIHIYPNPVTNILYVNSENGIIHKIEVFDALGIRIQTIEENFNQIDFSKYNIGIYFIKLYSEKGIMTKKIIK